MTPISLRGDIRFRLRGGLRYDTASGMWNDILGPNCRSSLLATAFFTHDTKPETNGQGEKHSHVKIETYVFVSCRPFVSGYYYYAFQAAIRWTLFVDRGVRLFKFHALEQSRRARFWNTGAGLFLKRQCEKADADEDWLFITLKMGTTLPLCRYSFQPALQL